MSNIPPSGHQPRKTNLAETVELLRTESDRGLALIVGEWLSEMARSLLRHALVDSSLEKRLLEGSLAPLGTFSARALACFAFGLISRRVSDALDIIRRIRNSAAHFAETSESDGVAFSLNDAATRSRIGDLRRLLEQSPQHLGVDSREEFIVCFAGLAGYMARRRDQIQRPGAPEDISTI
jgi:hypothetical protein